MSTNPSIAAALTALRASRDACLERLRGNSDFQALGAINRAIRELEPAEPQPGGVLSSILRMTPDRVPLPEQKPSQAAAAFDVLSKTSAMTIAALLPKVRERGAAVGGNDPETNLSSSLSRDGRFFSFKRDGQYLWALKPDVRQAVLSKSADTQSAELGDKEDGVFA